MQRPIVAIVGRPNVGKSALFNRIAGARIAIVEDEPGVTRDRLYVETSWVGRHFLLVDTGGIDTEGEGLVAATRQQAEVAIAEADVILFVVDVQQGLTPADQEVADLLRRTQKPVLVVANKADNPDLALAAVELYALGLSDPIPVSAVHGRNVGDLLDAVVAHLPSDATGEAEDDSIRVAFIGRPNVGKSSIVNGILGEERVIVSDIAGTTRDAIDTHFHRGDTRYVLIDTAGMRRRARIDGPVEHYSVVRTLRAIERADVCVVVLDASVGVLEQDKRVAGAAHEAGKGIVLAVNKWDLVEKGPKTMQQFDQTIRNELAFIPYAPVIYVSALKGQRLTDLIDLIEYVAQQHAFRISTGRFNELLQAAMARQEPPSDKGIRPRIYYGLQASVKPPHFILFANYPKLLHFSYLRYLENQLRENYGFIGTPIHFTVRQRE